MDLTPPGEIFQADFRPPTIVNAAAATAAVATASSAETIKLLQWNIERGYKLQGIIEELKTINADVISLQEVDVGCERTGSLNTGAPAVFLFLIISSQNLYYSLYLSSSYSCF
jgi:hypothetical protein